MDLVMTGNSAFERCRCQFRLRYYSRLSLSASLDGVALHLHVGGYRWRMPRGLPMNIPSGALPIA